MLTLFPRIKPNPLPPSLPPEPLEAKPVLVEQTADTTSAAIAIPNDASDSEEATAVAVSPAEASQPLAAEAVSPASAVTDSDLFAAFMSGMATANSDPFIVEITAHPSPKAVPEPSESQRQPPLQSAPSAPESAIMPDEDSAQFPERVHESPAQSPSTEQNADAAPDTLVAGQKAGDGFPAPQLYIAAANIFDELDILHEAATESIQPTAREPQEAVLAPEAVSAAELPSGSGIEAADVAPEAGSAENSTSAPEELVPASNVQLSTLTEIAITEIPASPSEEISGESSQDPSDPRENQSAIGAAELRPASIETASSETTPITEANEPASPQQAQLEPSLHVQSSGSPKIASSAPQEEVPVSTPPAPEPAKKAAFGAQLSVPKPKRAKGTLCGLARVPEAEAMDDSGEVDAYASAAAQSYLDAIDDTFVAHTQLLLKGRERGRALDIGTGPGQIVIKLGYRLTLWKFIGIDRSAAMIEKARESLATAGELAGRIEFRVADGNALDFPDKTFDLVVCNSVLHHLAEPQKLFAEIARIVKPAGAILLRDLRRPSRWGYSYHVWKHGKYYAGEMRRLFTASVMAAYTDEELQKMVAASALRDVRVFFHGKTHIGFERPTATIAERKR